MYAPAGFVNHTQVAQIVDEAIRGLDPRDVVHVAYSIGNDWTDDPAIFFRVVLTDEAAGMDRLRDAAGRVKDAIYSIGTLENWGLISVCQVSQLLGTKSTERTGMAIERGLP